MAKYRNDLPQLKGGIFLSDGGIETTLIFHDGVDLPHFAAFVLLDTDEGRARLKRYYERYLGIARARGTGFVLDSATWRASSDWGEKLGYDADALKAINIGAIRLLEELRDEWETPATPDRGQRRDRPARRRLQGRPDGRPDEAEAYHAGADRDFRRDRRRHGGGLHDEHYRRGDRHRPGGRAGRHAVRDLVHGRDRRAAGDGQDAARGDRDGRRRRPAATGSTT